MQLLCKNNIYFIAIFGFLVPESNKIEEKIHQQSRKWILCSVTVSCLLNMRTAELLNINDYITPTEENAGKSCIHTV